MMSFKEEQLVNNFGNGHNIIITAKHRELENKYVKKFEVIVLIFRLLERNISPNTIIKILQANNIDAPAQQSIRNWNVKGHNVYEDYKTYGNEYNYKVYNVDECIAKYNNTEEAYKKERISKQVDDVFEIRKRGINRNITDETIINAFEMREEKRSFEFISNKLNQLKLLNNGKEWNAQSIRLIILSDTWIKKYNDLLKDRTPKIVAEYRITKKTEEKEKINYHMSRYIIQEFISGTDISTMKKIIKAQFNIDCSDDKIMEIVNDNNLIEEYFSFKGISRNSKEDMEFWEKLEHRNENEFSKTKQELKKEFEEKRRDVAEKIISHKHEINTPDHNTLSGKNTKKDEIMNMILSMISKYNKIEKFSILDASDKSVEIRICLNKEENDETI